MLSSFKYDSSPAVAAPVAIVNPNVIISPHLELKETKQAKQIGIRKICVISLKDEMLTETANIINIISIFLKEQGEMLKAPKMSKADPSDLKIFFQEDFHNYKLKCFIKEKFKIPDSHVIFDYCNERRAKAEATPAPNIKSELAKMDPSKPQLILKAILENPDIKYLILGEYHDMQAAHTLLQSNKTAFIANGYEVIASEFYPCIKQPAIDFQHFLKPEKKITLIAQLRSREPTIAKLAEAGLRLIALEGRCGINGTSTGDMPDDRLEVFDASAATQIHQEVVKRQEKGFALSRNVGGKGKVIIWVGAAHVPGIAQYLTRAHTLSIGARDIPATSAEHCELNGVFEDSRATLDVIFNIPEKAPGAS